MGRGVLLAVGDVGPDRPDPRENFSKVASVLCNGDAVFAQLELPISEGGIRHPQARHTSRAPLTTAQAMARAGINVASFASNHCMDWGYEVMLETMTRLRDEGIGAIGAGQTLREARRPHVIETPGGRIAFLAYCSILPQDYWATERRAGCAPMRAYTHYEQIEHDQPGTPCRVHTFANRGDLQMVCEDIAAARTVADVVAVSFHWGIHFIPATIADYQREVAHAVIDAGADLILGHHAHILKGIEMYRGKAIFYSLGNFAIDLPMTQEHMNAKSFLEIKALNPDWPVSVDSLFNCPRDSRRTMVVRGIVQDGALKEVGFLPAYIDDVTSIPEILSPDNVRFEEVVDYVRAISGEAGLPMRCEVRGDAAVLLA